MKDKFKKFIEKDGFYIILFICVCIVAITAVLTSKNNLDRSNEDNLSEIEEDFIILDNELDLEDSIETSTEEEDGLEDDELEEEDEQQAEEDVAEEEIIEEPEEEEIAEEVEQDEEIAEETEEVEETMSQPEQTNNVTEIITPVDGTVGKDYTEDTLVYSETLEQWRTHKGVDIMAAENSQVVAVLSGTVQEVYDDPLWGKVIILDHGNDFLTKYTNLSSEELIEEGISVDQGEVIGRIGDTASIEMMMEPHIHFEIIEEGISINPKNYLPVFIYSN